ncbi:hypothetical protein DXG01_013110 [Tephrocybe rancida]|nr:hypothetical protein DXG01_013110 [Tephrocybe rancida]
MSQGQRNALLQATAMGQRSTSHNTQYKPVSAKSFTPSDELTSLKGLTYGNWKPTGYSTASSQASRLASKTHARPLALQQTPDDPPTQPTTRALTAASHGASKRKTAPKDKVAVHSPTAVSLIEIAKSQKALDVLRSEFAFPNRLDFHDSPTFSDSSPLGYLAFTTINRPVREHKEALIQLQTRLDAIPSHGDDMIRASRKKAVDKVDQALHQLEDEVQRCLEEWRSRPFEKAPPEMPVLEKPPPKELPLTPPSAPQEPPVTLAESDATVRALGFRLPPLPTPDVCRLVADDFRFHKAYRKMTKDLTEIQLQRLQAVGRGEPTDKYDQALFDVDQDWNDLVHALVLVTRNEQQIGPELLHAFDDLDSESEDDSELKSVQTNYLRLALDPYEDQKARAHSNSEVWN